jgi:EAL domain-containing protein (putative c-di-GMP-specific phosphodiesterase class I)
LDRPGQSGLPGALDLPEVIAAPFSHLGTVMGSVVLGIDPAVRSDSDAARSRLLAAAIDSAALVGVVLGPGLEASEHVWADRTRLADVIEQRQFTPVFQPIVDLASRQVVGYEALTRFADGTRPDVRFAEATRIGMGLDLELAAAAAALDVSDALPASQWLTINVSPELVVEGARLRQLLANRSRRIILEVTEHAVIDDYELVRDALDRLRPLAGIGIDDAGAGFASLRHILELEPDLVKLDVSLVRNVEQDPLRQALVAGLVHFAATANCDLLGEAIETEAEAKALVDLRVELGQGYLFGRPAPLESSI